MHAHAGAWRLLALASWTLKLLVAGCKPGRINRATLDNRVRFLAAAEASVWTLDGSSKAVNRCLMGFRQSWRAADATGAGAHVRVSPPAGLAYWHTDLSHGVQHDSNHACR